MSHVAWSVNLSVHMSLFVLGTRMCCAKMAEPTEMPFERLTHVDPRNHILGEGQDRTNPFDATRGDKTTMWPFVKIL